MTTSFPIRGDGREAAGSFVSDLAELLGERVSVKVVAPGERECIETWSPGVEVFRFRAPDKPLSTLSFMSFRDLVAAFRVMRSGSRVTERAVTSGPTAHVLALWALPCGYWAKRCSGKHAVPYSTWTLGSDIWSLGRVPVVRWFLRLVLRQGRYCFSDGLGLAQETQKLADREVIFLPSTRRILSQPASRTGGAPFVLTFLGRWHANKGVDILLEALGLLSDEDWNRIESVRINGGGPMEATVRRRVSDLQGAGRPVHAGGFLDKQAAEASINDADYLLIPSRIESIPLVFSDAMKLRCPVVAMPVGDLPALVGQGVGELAVDVTARAFSDAISRILRRNPVSFQPAMECMAARFDVDVAARSLLGKLLG
ncbi:glycosyltransferase [Lysobacter sp. SG-8]|uniref:Glycosyltransferase n=1 Tax=Marilutibacter penaei TaxID=2759900 RepID=A0A7W3YEB4_9GAMM|nr:glycosyltransferase [Lysobacter penaei]